MANVIRKLGLSRRTFLRGAGAALALPWLDAMASALTPLASDKVSPVRALFIYVPNGKKMDEFVPKSKGTLGDLPWILEPLAKHRSSINVLSGLTQDGGRAHGDGPGDHARAVASFLTCAHPFKTGGADISVGQSFDQYLAEKIGSKTTFPSLELGTEPGRSAGVCDSGYSCAYTNNISWKTPNTPVAKETNPKEVFKRLFGDPGAAADKAAAAERERHRRSVLDLVMEDAKSLRSRLGAADAAKLDQYFGAVRELETRIDRAAANPVDVPAIEWKRSSEDGYGEKIRLMQEIIVLAFAADLTRVITFMYANAGSNRSYAQIGIPEGHHDLSHHGNKEASLKKIREINRYHIGLFAGLLDRLESTKDASGDLLANTAVVYGSGLGDGNRHNHDDLPVLLAGRGGGRIKGGRHLSFAKNTPMADLYVSLMPVMGLQSASFGDSKSSLEI